MSYQAQEQHHGRVQSLPGGGNIQNMSTNNMQMNQIPKSRGGPNNFQQMTLSNSTQP